MKMNDKRLIEQSWSKEVAGSYLHINLNIFHNEMLFAMICSKNNKLIF